VGRCIFGSCCPNAMQRIVVKMSGFARGERRVGHRVGPSGSSWGDGAEGSKANRAMGNARDQADPARCWGFGLAIARPWKTGEEQALQNLVTPLPPKDAPGTRGPRAQGRNGRKTFWTDSPRVCLRHGGAVTVVWSKKGRHVSPQQTTILGTNRAEVTPSPVVCISQKRWAIAVLNWALPSGLGGGKPQGSGTPNRSEQSVGSAVLASWCVLRGCPHEMVPGKPGSLFQLQHALRRRVMTNQVEHTVKGKRAKTRKAA
jgi:hypothetical protein